MPCAEVKAHVAALQSSVLSLVPEIADASDVTKRKQSSDLVKRTGNSNDGKIDSRIMFLWVSVCVCVKAKKAYLRL